MSEEVKPEEVADFIAGKKKPFSFKISKDELPEGALEKLQEASKAEEIEAPKSDTPMPDDFNPENTIVNDIFNSQKLEKLLGKIKVTEIDKDLYMKALLNDEPFVTTVQPIHGIDITVKSRALYEDEIVYHCLRIERDSGEILGPETYFTRLQLFLAGMQVVKIGNKVVKFEYDEKDTFEEIHEKLKAHVAKVYNPMQAPKWNAIVAAVRVFEAKLKICNDNLRDENFWHSAGIA
jgi:hypothetical protein